MTCGKVAKRLGKYGEGKTMNKLFTKEDFERVYKGKRVLVLGNTGFKGSWLSLWLLMLGADVTGYALEPAYDESHFSILELNKKMPCTFGDIRDAERLCKFIAEVQPEYVFHLAAQAIVSISFREPKTTFDTNIGGSVNVLEAIRAVDSVRSLIYVTSDKCYKNKEWLWGYRENDELGGIDPYSVSKACAELVFGSYKQCFFDNKRSIGISSVRAGNVIGGGDWADNRIVPDCIRALMSGNPIEVRNPNATRPWQHVLEPLSGYLTLAALQHQDCRFSESWNFGPGNEAVHTVEELVTGVIGRWGNGELSVVPSGIFHESTLLKLDCDKAYQKLGWKARWGFGNTVNETTDWYMAYSKGEMISQSQIEKYMKEGI
jgi:CDP-glucose 4,6-dehydratase